MQLIFLQILLTTLKVGGGTAGAVLASRLAEDFSASILLVEAGSNPGDNPLIDTPLMADSARNTEFDWKYKTEAQKSACKGHLENVSCLSIAFFLLACKTSGKLDFEFF